MNDWDESILNEVQSCCGHLPLMYDIRKKFEIFCPRCKFKVNSENTKSAVTAWNAGRTK